MTTKTLAWCGVGAVILLGVLARQTNDGKEGAAEVRQEAPAPQAESLEELAAADIFATYQENEIRAEGLLKGKRFIVAGTVKAIGKDVLGTPYLSFETGSPVFGVQAMFARKDAGKLAGFSPGNQAKAACTGGGKLGNVILRDCELR